MKQPGPEPSRWTRVERLPYMVPEQSPGRLKRRHWIEISDEPWCPLAIRYAVMDYCPFVLAASKAYDAIAPILAEALRRNKTCHVLDLASGAAGPWVGLQPLLRSMGVDVSVCLTDHCPNVEAFERAHRLTQQAITYHPQPVDAAQVPSELSGFRTIFMAFHHFRPNQARAVLAHAVAKGEGIGVFECAERSLLMVFLVAIVTLIRVLVVSAHAGGEARVGHFQRQGHGECGTFAVLTGYSQIPAHELAELSAQSQAQARPTILFGRRGLGLGKSLKQLTELLGGHADPGVGHCEADGMIRSLNL